MYQGKESPTASISDEPASRLARALAMFCRILVFIGLAQAFTSLAQLCPPKIVSQLDGPQFYYANSSVHLTSDGGLISGGYSFGYGPGGTNYGLADFYLVRLNSNLELVWNRVYGGTNSDWLQVARQTIDGGFILAGESWSGPSGTKTSTNNGWADFWVLRTDADGNPLWDQSFGGAGYESPSDVRETSDGGFIVGGYSTSDAGGNKTTPNYGLSDCWVVRLDAAGNKIWERSFGGAYTDRIVAIQETADGGFIIGAISESPQGGNKTEPWFGAWDYWVIRLDAAGNELWQRSFGGESYDQLYDVRQGDDGGFLLVGTSYSAPSGNKTSPVRSYQDYWIVALDADGNKIWEESVGGGSGTSSQPKNIATMPDGGWVVGGTFQTSLGPTPGGNKTSPNFGQSDYWLVRFDAAGNIVWDQGYGGRNTDMLYAMERGSDGRLVLIGQSASKIDGNKTTPLLSSSDFWVLKLGSETPGDCDGDGVPDGQDLCPGTVSGVVNSNGCSIAQLCPCDGPWTNHDEYVACVTRVSSDFLQAGLITEVERNNTVAQAMAANCPFVPAPVIAFGLTNFPIRYSSVAFGEGSGGLFVSDLSFEGLDGVSMRAGQVDSGVYFYPYAPVGDSYNEAWFMLASAYGSLNAGTNSLLSTMRGTKPSYEVYPVEVDFSALGADSVTYQVYADKSLVAQATEVGPIGRITVNSASYLNPRANPLYRAPDGAIGALIDLDTSESPYRFSITGPFYAAAGNHIYIWANNPTNSVDFVSRVDLVEGGGLESFSVLDARLGMFHRAHQALGAALFGAAAGKLTVSAGTNYYGSYEDYSNFAGTMIEANEAARFDVQVEPIRLDTNGAVFETYLSSSIDTVPDIFASVGITNEGGILFLDSTFSPFYGSDTNVNPQTIVLRIYDNGSFAGAVTNSGNPISISAGNSIPAIVNCGGGGNSNAVRYTAFTLDRRATFNDGNGTILEGNQFRLVFSNDDFVPASVSKLTLAVRNMPSFTILDEHSESGPPGLGIALENDTVVLSWPNDNQPFILESTDALGNEFSPVQTSIVFSGNRNTVTLPSGITQFFRLHLSED